MIIFLSLEHSCINSLEYSMCPLDDIKIILTHFDRDHVL